MESSIRSVTQLLLFFKSIKRSLFYIGHIFGASLLTLNDFMPTFEIISCCDPFFGACSFIKVPSGVRDNHKCLSITHCPLALMKMQEVITYMKTKDPKPCIITAVITEQIQRICKDNCIQFWGVSAELYNELGNKVKIIDLLKMANIPYIDNVCSLIESYEQLRQVSKKFGAVPLVVQDQFGIGGKGTIFISNENDYIQHISELQIGKELKIMPFKRLKCFAIGGIALRSGTVMGPLQSQLIGHQQLAPFRGGYCGNQIRKSYFQDQKIQLQIRKQILNYSVKFANFLYKVLNFRGTFGMDFSVDMDTNEIYFMEINPRLTGSTSLSFQYYHAQGHQFPIFLFHCLEYLEVNLCMNIEALNNEWIGLDNYKHQVSHLVTKCMNQAEISLPFTFAAGLWKLENDELKFTGKTEFRLNEMADDEIFFIPNRGFSKGNIIIKRRCQDYQFKLTKKSKKLIGKFINLRLKDTET